jgi:hypothetical protein
MSVAPVVVQGVGAVTALGRSTTQTALMLRAGKRAHARVGARMGGARSYACRLRDLPDDVIGSQRLAQLALPALREATTDLGAESVPIVAALPSGDLDAAAWLDMVARVCNLPIDPLESAVVQGHHAAGIAACQLAIRKLQAGADAVVVGGVDSLYREPVVRQFARAAHQPESAEVIAGEAAAFVVLRRAKHKDAGHGVVLAHTSTLSNDAAAQLLAAEAREGALVRQHHYHRLSRSAAQPTDGDPLRALLERAAEVAPEPSWLISDALRRQPSLQRLTRAMHGVIDATAQHDRFGLQLGDLGAATAVVHLAIAYGWMGMGCAPARDVLIVSCEHERERGVLRLTEVT